MVIVPLVIGVVTVRQRLVVVLEVASEALTGLDVRVRQVQRGEVDILTGRVAVGNEVGQ